MATWPVLAVVYLIFNEGYGGRVDLAAEGIRLGRALAELMPDEAEVHGLLALMLLHDARRQARFSGEDLVLLADQDRSQWNVCIECAVHMNNDLAKGPTEYQREVRAVRHRGPPLLRWTAPPRAQGEPRPAVLAAVQSRVAGCQTSLG